MNSVKMNLVALLVCVVFLGCSGLNLVKDSPENKILGQWRIFSEELPSIKACEENISNEEACKDLWYKYSVFDECSYLLFNNQNELLKYSGKLKQKELGKTKYSVKEKVFLIRDGEKEINYILSFENNILILQLSDKDFLKFKRVMKVSKISEPEKIPQMKPVLLFLKALEQSDITLFEKTLSSEMETKLGKDGINKEFKDIVRFFQEMKGDSEQIEFIVEENDEKEWTVYINKSCLSGGLDIIKDIDSWKIKDFSFGGGCSGTS